MDSQKAWEELLDRVQAKQTEEAADVAERLLPWLNQWGKAPQFSLFHRLPEPLCRIVARAACETILEEAGREYS